MDEQIVLVDDAGNAIGSAPKLASHHANTPLHKAFSCYVFNEQGQFLLTQRAHSKKVWPDVWTNSVCGHPAPDETDESAVKRRLDYELGITEFSHLVCIGPNYRYTTPPYNGIIENEICPVYIAIVTQQPQPNPDEVEAYRWVDWTDIPKLIETEPDTLSYWLKDQYDKIFSNNIEFVEYLESTHAK